MTTTLDIPTTAGPDLSLARLHAMRGGYLLMGVGLALVKWPKLPSARAQPAGVRRCHPLPAHRDVLAGVPRPALPRQDAPGPAVRGPMEAAVVRCRGAHLTPGSRRLTGRTPRRAPSRWAGRGPVVSPRASTTQGRVEIRTGVVPDGNGGCGRAGSEHDHHPRSPALPPPLAHAPSTAVSTAASPPWRSTAPSTSSSSPSSRGATSGPPS